MFTSHSKTSYYILADPVPLNTKVHQGLINQTRWSSLLNQILHTSWEQESLTRLGYRNVSGVSASRRAICGRERETSRFLMGTWCWVVLVLVLVLVHGHYHCNIWHVCMERYP
jgi:hypothetical protein